MLAAVFMYERRMRREIVGSGVGCISGNIEEGVRYSGSKLECTS